MSEEIVKQGSTALAVPSDVTERLLALSKRVPAEYKESVLALVPPHPGEFAEITEGLPGEYQEKILAFIRKVRPKKQGVHTAREGFSPTDVKLFHGTGTDALRPRNALPGCLYTSESKILYEGPGAQAIDIAVLNMFESRILWPPKEQGDTGGAAKTPLCVSFDRKKGSRYGDCKDCPNAQKRYDQGGCVREVVATFVDRDLTGIYTMHFGKSSLGAGEAMMKIAMRSDEIYGRWFRMETQERTQGQNRWFVIKTAPVADAKNPKNEYTEKVLHPLLNAFSRLIDFDYYWPGLANSYDRLENASAEAGATPAETFDEDALAGKNPGSGETPDYSA